MPLLFLFACAHSAELREAMSRLSSGAGTAVLIAAGALVLVGARGQGVRLLTGKSRPLPGALARAIASGAALSWFEIPLIRAWTSAGTNYSQIGGLLPWSDAHGYLFGARQLIIKGFLDPWSMRRPLNAILLALRLQLVGGDLRKALVLQALLLGLACLLAARVVAREFGPGAGVVMFGGLYAFGSSFVSLTLSESLGLTLGAFAFACFWEAKSSFRPFVVGLTFLLLSLALNARAGAYFVVPGVAIWMAWRIRGNRRAQLRVLAVAAVGTALGFALTFAVVARYGRGPSNLNGNFSWTLYGLAVGGKGWTQVAVDHPELSALPDAAQNHAILHLALAKIRADPTELGVGLARGMKAFVNESAPFLPVPSVGLSRWPLAGLVAAALLASRRRRYLWKQAVLAASIIVTLPFLLSGGPLALPRLHGDAFIALIVVVAIVMVARLSDPHPGLFLAATAGTLASAPFIMDGGARSLAATAPFLAYGLVLVMLAVARRLPADGQPAEFPAATPPAKSLGPQSWPAIAAGLAVTAAVAIGVPRAGANIAAAHPTLACSPALLDSTVRVTAGLRFDARTARSTFAPRISIERFQGNLVGDENELSGVLRRLDSPSTLVLGFIEQGGTRVAQNVPGDRWLVGPPKFPTKANTRVHICGMIDPNSLPAYPVTRVISWSRE